MFFNFLHAFILFNHPFLSVVIRLWYNYFASLVTLTEAVCIEMVQINK
jgi:hypothetical protein